MKIPDTFSVFHFLKLLVGLPPWRRPCLRAGLCSLKSWKILYSWNRIMQFGEYFSRCKFNKGNENKIPIFLAQPTQIVRYVRTSLWGTDDYTGHPLPNTVGNISRIPFTPMFCTSWLSKQMPSLPGSAEEPGKILKFRCNLRLYPINFRDKLCIFNFITLSIW